MPWRVSSLQRRSSRSRACGGSTQSAGHPGQACRGSSRRGGACSREAPVPFPGSFDMAVSRHPHRAFASACKTVRRCAGRAVRRSDSTLVLVFGLSFLPLVRCNEVAVVVHATRREGSGKASESRKEHRRRPWRRRSPRRHRADVKAAHPWPAPALGRYLGRSVCEADSFVPKHQCRLVAAVFLAAQHSRRSVRSLQSPGPGRRPTPLFLGGIDRCAACARSVHRPVRPSRGRTVGRKCVAALFHAAERPVPDPHSPPLA